MSKLNNQGVAMSNHGRQADYMPSGVKHVVKVNHNAKGLALSSHGRMSDFMVNPSKKVTKDGKMGVAPGMKK